MKLRIKSHWFDEDRERTLSESASAFAFIAWRLSVEKAVNLHCERFVYEDPSPEFVQRISHVFEVSDGNLQLVVSAILFSPEFRSRRAMRTSTSRATTCWWNGMMRAGAFRGSST